ncbi:HNH endonuclease [Aminobacter aganoensis]|uniref:5-methylcytosine-specific restriction endonuclease McrA n=1 Tax=Aminobacter aganoensis TaxID=83264 RepID=A0A7X0KNI7_9HYPH|nr:HNH endonuclease signature motif containing protein [Aminobacter aganoensis]MBB6357196.1 5-methylcytosine-specific restriction endonuclease McrA [Aminobacter aganoensis]
MADKRKFYYEARGFSVYYFANAVFNIVNESGSYLRGIEDVLGDAQTMMLMRPFHRFTNLHHFLEAIIRQIVEEEVERLDEDKPRFLRKFLSTYRVPFSPNDLEDEDSFYDFTAESDRYHNALEELADEVFHVLFNDVGFLQTFNRLCSGHIETSGFGAELTTRTGQLKRVAIPMWARRAIFHRDKGECRECKRSLAATVNQMETERYDHIVPLARFGANDVTNLQLLCEACNSKKAAAMQSVSPLYPRAIIPR